MANDVVYGQVSGSTRDDQDDAEDDSEEEDVDDDDDDDDDVRDGDAYNTDDGSMGSDYVSDYEIPEIDYLDGANRMEYFDGGLSEE